MNGTWADESEVHYDSWQWHKANFALNVSNIHCTIVYIFFIYLNFGSRYLEVSVDTCSSSHYLELQLNVEL